MFIVCTRPSYEKIGRCSVLLLASTFDSDASCNGRRQDLQLRIMDVGCHQRLVIDMPLEVQSYERGLCDYDDPAPYKA